MKYIILLLFTSVIFTAEPFHLSSLVLIRHGEGEHNVRKIWSETAPLTEKGYKQALDTGKLLLSQGISSEDISVVYVSPRLRTRQTVQALVDTGLIQEDQIIFDERLKEVHVGTLEGKKMVPWGDKELWDLPFADEVGGETLSLVRERIISFLNHINQQKHKGHVFVVSHGTPLREILGALGHERVKLGTAEARILSFETQ